jgi:SAM-dependent methyltransferase
VVGAGYDAIGVRYREWSANSPVRLRFVDEVLRQLPAGSTVVDLGCGPGEPATRRLSERHRVLGVDLSAGQLRLARQVARQATLVRADMTEFALRPSSVDAVVSFYALGHLPPTAHAPLFRAISLWLRPGGLLRTSAPVSADDGIEADWLGVPMYFGGIGMQATLDAVADLVVDDGRTVAEDEGGRLVQFLWLSAHARQLSADLGIHIDVSNVAEALDVLDGPGAR